MKMTKKMVAVVVCVIAAMVGVMALHLKLAARSTAAAEMTEHYYDLAYRSRTRVMIRSYCVSNWL